MSWNKATKATAADVNADSTTTATTAVGAGFRRGRVLAAASLVAVAALALTACGNDQDGAKASTKVSSSPLPAAPSEDAASHGNAQDSKGGAAQDPKKSAGKNGGSSAGASEGSGTGGAGSGSGSTAGSGSAAQGKGVNGTLNGVLKYLAPGKLTVAPASGTEQAFYVGSQTKTLGAAGICASNGNVTADSNGYGTSPCTEAQLEKAAKMNSIEVRVTVEGGVATKIVEHYRS
ncbi:hypothetical protein [Streptomyces nigrescens]